MAFLSSKTKLLAVPVALAIGLVVALAVYVNSDSIIWGWTERNINHTKLNGEMLIERIESFRKENGRLPKLLDELVPKHIASVPVPAAGENRWHYNLTGDGDTFYLGFSLPRDATWHGYPSCFYDSRYKFWHMDE